MARQDSKFDPSALEVPFTECLRDGMRAALKSRGLKNIVVLPGTESRSKPSLRIPDGRTDIPIFVTDVFIEMEEHDPHAIIECKRLDGNDSDLVREYVVSGINRFCSGQYSSNHRYGFMVGYLLAGTTKSVAVAAVNKFIAKHKSVAEELAMHQSQPDVWKSKHLREENDTIFLFHSFLKVKGTTKNEGSSTFQVG
ncbi:hypothetical protein GHYDROH2_10520 [Geobacter hydrogenophilus]|uniref:Uncharacterized protein n=2 Tax=Geobacter hydrogenophilus TaxID=40983 RepID=A0A9W6FZ38_9BACT|nr:hypothetical protein GHYDROH2_10520 [Geobacter hydrogenophilus]